MCCAIDQKSAWWRLVGVGLIASFVAFRGSYALLASVKSTSNIIGTTLRRLATLQFWVAVCIPCSRASRRVPIVCAYPSIYLPSHWRAANRAVAAVRPVFLICARELRPLSWLSSVCLNKFNPVMCGHTANLLHTKSCGRGLTRIPICSVSLARILFFCLAETFLKLINMDVDAARYYMAVTCLIL